MHARRLARPGLGFAGNGNRLVGVWGGPSGLHLTSLPPRPPCPAPPGTLFFNDFTVYDSSQRMKTWDRTFRNLLSYPQVRGLSPKPSEIRSPKPNLLSSTRREGCGGGLS